MEMFFFAECAITIYDVVLNKTRLRVNMKLRHMDAADLPDFVEILNQAISDGCVAFTIPVEVGEFENWFLSHQNTAHPAFVAEIDGVLAGWVTLSPYRPGRAALSKTVEVSYGVHRSYRRQGVGTAMLQRILDEARFLNHRIVFAIVFDSNIGTQKLLENAGFVKWGHLPNVAEMAGQLIGHDYYGLQINE